MLSRISSGWPCDISDLGFFQPSLALIFQEDACNPRRVRVPVVTFEASRIEHAETWDV